MGMMCCEDLTAYVFARVGEVPTTENECVAVATTLGLSGPGGKSYLYIKNFTRTELQFCWHYKNTYKKHLLVCKS